MVLNTRRISLRQICDLNTPSEVLNLAFRCAKDNISRTMRYYSLGWGMSNAPHHYCIVVGRDTGWMGVGIDYVAPWFSPLALDIFRITQKPSGQIVEYVDMETGYWDDYGLNLGDNNPLYCWGLNHHWQMHQDENAHERFRTSMRRAAEYMLEQMGKNGLIVTVPAGTATRGITSWRNIIPDYVLAGEVTEINSEAAFALIQAAEYLEDDSFREAGEALSEQIRTKLWNDGTFLLTRFRGEDNPQVTGDQVFPVLFGVADEQQRDSVLKRLRLQDFWTGQGLRTLPTSDSEYHPTHGYGLLGGSWPNLTLWYAAAVASTDPDEALKSIEIVAKPVVDPKSGVRNINLGEFPEYFHGEQPENLGMKLSPWVAPTFIWAVMEGLLGFSWEKGQPTVNPNWPADWNEVTVRNIPVGNPTRRWLDVRLVRGEEPQLEWRDEPSWAEL